ncbi:hypothetical protein GCM10025868_46030 [Angustibacter aerolatus]|uniref:Sec-independent protein translocase protein TatA n=1 Tax=Angustibacter aerolatus TaxID=1162965 RepID=A0ABQ6JM72_9ACTN|nr:Sec-independent protein translocase subunit TatA [Angustibacter aerolatus]GMA89353.1 hypothetical protein GCM10025868_46030 [Angustibacter aerolatus]
MVLLVLVAILFGGKRLPDAARGLGRSLRIFKSEVKQMKDDDDVPDADVRTSTSTAQPPTRTTPVEGRIVDERAPHGTTTGSGTEPRDTRA